MTGDRIDAALRVLAEYVTLPYEGQRLVPRVGSADRMTADARNREMMERVLAAAGEDDVERRRSVPGGSGACASARAGAGGRATAGEMVERAAEAASVGDVAGAEDALAARPRPDLVSRMIDARDCLRGIPRAPQALPFEEERRLVAAALRWLDEGIEEGMAMRELFGRLRLLVAGEPHVCTCGDSHECEGCSKGFEDRCRFEQALRTLVGVEGSG